MQAQIPGLVLASGSRARAQILTGAGLIFDVHVSGVDEAAIKISHHGSVQDLALKLASAKAAASTMTLADKTKLVLAADQILACGDRLFDKPASREEAAKNLRFLRGRKHQLINGLVLYQAGEQVWAFSDAVELTMRDFSDAFLESYLDAEGDSVLGSVGAYRLESRGSQLFDDISGDYFSILGLPLLPLLAALRTRNLVAC